MKILSSLILSFILILLSNCSDSGKSLISTDCTEELDCAGECGGSSTVDICGLCDGDESTCNISFSATVQPILSNCTSCHGSGGGLNLSSYDNLMQGGSSGTPVIAGNGNGSLLIQKLRGTSSSGSQMPKGNDPLNASTINLIETWINEGAQNN